MAGYSGYSKSNNAVIAETEGRYSLTHAAKLLAKQCGISIKAARALCVAHGTSEYHHSSKFYNRVNYYDVVSISNWFNDASRREAFEPYRSLCVAAHGCASGVEANFRLQPIYEFIAFETGLNVESVENLYYNLNSESGE